MDSLYRQIMILTLNAVFFFFWSDFMVGYVNRYSKSQDMGCFVSTPKVPSGNRSRLADIGDVFAYVPGWRIPKQVDFSHSLGTSLPMKIVEHLSALRTRIVVMASQEAPIISRTRRKSATQDGASWHMKKRSSLGACGL